MISLFDNLPFSNDYLVFTFLESYMETKDSFQKERDRRSGACDFSDMIDLEITGRLL